MSSSGARKWMRAHRKDRDLWLNHIPECRVSMIKSIPVALDRVPSSRLRVSGTQIPERSSSPAVSNLTLRPNPCVKQIKCRALRERIWKIPPPTICPLVPSNLQRTPVFSDGWACVASVGPSGCWWGAGPAPSLPSLRALDQLAWVFSLFASRGGRTLTLNSYSLCGSVPRPWGSPWSPPSLPPPNLCLLVLWQQSSGRGARQALVTPTGCWASGTPCPGLGPGWREAERPSG